MGMAIGIRFEPCMIHCGSIVISPPTRVRCSPPLRIFPFRFAGQAVRPAAIGVCRSAHLCVQPADVRARIIPAHAHYWITVSLNEPGILPIQIWLLIPFETVFAASIAWRMSGFADKHRVFAPRDIVFSQSEKPQ